VIAPLPLKLTEIEVMPPFSMSQRTVTESTMIGTTHSPPLVWT
jgi:hypothetical protein